MGRCKHPYNPHPEANKEGLLDFDDYLKPNNCPGYARRD
jgi:hypothetical protein